METLKDLIRSDNNAVHNISRWESDSGFRRKRTITKHLDSLTTYVGNHVALQYYLLDNYVTIKGDGKMSLAEALLKLKLLKAIYKVAVKENEEKVVKKLIPVIKEYEKKIEREINGIKLLKPL